MGSNQVLHVNIPTPKGHLEAILKPEEEGSQPLYAGLVCHPHPLGGGTMHNKVVFKGGADAAKSQYSCVALQLSWRWTQHRNI